MLYTLFVLITGVYIGQEYTIVPSVKILTMHCLNYLNNINPQENLQNNNDRNLEGEESIYKWVLQKFKLA